MFLAQKHENVQCKICSHLSRPYSVPKRWNATKMKVVILGGIKVIAAQVICTAVPHCRLEACTFLKPDSLGKLATKLIVNDNKATAFWAALSKEGSNLPYLHEYNPNFPPAICASKMHPPRYIRACTWGWWASWHLRITSRYSRNIYIFSFLKGPKVPPSLYIQGRAIYVQIR